MPALRFKTCRLLLGNVWKKELTIIQLRILKRLQNRKRSIKKRISARENLNSYIKLQTTRKLSLFHGNLPLSQMQRGRKRTSYIPFLLNSEKRLDVILVRIHFRKTIPQARQPISHRKVCVNNRMVSIINFKVSQGDLISFQENDARTRSKEIRRSFYIDISVEKIIRKYVNYLEYLQFLEYQKRKRKEKNKNTKNKIRPPLRLTRREKKRRRLKEWKNKSKCYHELKSYFLSKELRSFMKELFFKRTRSAKICLGSSFAENNEIKNNFLEKKFLLLLKRKNDKNRNLPTRTRSPILNILYDSLLPLPSLDSLDSLDSNDYDVGTPYLPPLDSNLDSKNYNIVMPYVSHFRVARNRKRQKFNKKVFRKKRIKRLELPTHYSEVNYRTLKAVVFYGPNISHIPHNIRLKDLNLLLWSRKGRGQNI